jgi:hypothetical protein
MEQNKEIDDNMKLEGLVQLLDMGVSNLKHIMLMKEKMWKVIEPSLAQVVVHVDCRVWNGKLPRRLCTFTQGAHPFV